MKRTLAGAICGVMLITTAACGGVDPATTEQSGSPLAEYLGDGDDFSAGSSSSLGGDDPEKQQQVQELVAACMKAAGFEYLPYVPTMPEQQPILDGDIDWAATFGYGISTIDNAPPDPSDDPNTAITAAMGESERAAYQQALFGSSFQSTRSGSGPVAGPPPVAIAPQNNGGPDGSTAPPTGDADSAPGCVPQASAQVYGEPDVVDTQEFSSLFEALGTLQTAVREDPRVIPLVAAWSDCMADAGHPGFTEVDDARNSIMTRWADLNGWEFKPVDGGGGSVSVTSDDEITKPDPAKVAEIRADEIALAVIDLGCRKDHQAVYEQVRTELEQKFVNEHLSELERYRDTTSGGN